MKKIFFFLSLLFLVQVAIAQTMTDEQVMNFIIAEQEKGANQQAIATKLIKKGVSVERLRKIKEKYEAQKEQLGASDLLGTSSVKTTRVRTQQAQKMDDKQRRENNMLISAREEQSKRFRTQKQTQLDFEKEMEFLDIDSVLYYKNMFKDETPVFGRDIFNNELLTFEPALNIPVPSNYVLGAGDQVIIDVWGASQTIIDEVISPDGYLVIEGMGPVKLAGKTIEEANQYIKETLGEIYSDSQVNLTVGAIRTVQVQVMGEVITPGTYTLSALSTAFNALYAAGGINDLGTMRAIKVYRDGKLISTIDIYDYILNGNITGNVRLQDNDVITVGAYDALVNLQGKVKRPMFYEMKSDESISSLINYSGGFSGNAYKENLRVVRKSGREYSIFTVTRDNMSSFNMCDGDSVYVDSIIPRYSNMVEITGAVFYPGQYEYGKDIKTIKELINIAGGIREDAFLNRAVLHHRNHDNTIEAQSVDVKGILDGTVADMELRNNDIVFIPSKSDMKGEQTMRIGGEVRFPGVYKFADNTTIEDLILQAGGLTRAASVTKIDVFRQIYDPKAKMESDNISETYTFELKDGFIVDGNDGFILQPFDEVYVRRTPVHFETQNVTIEGSVNFAGDYLMTSKNYKLSDLINSAGGFTANAYPKGAYLYRKMTEEEIAQRDATLNATQIALYEEVLRTDKNVDLAILDSLYKAKLNTTDFYPVAINLEAALKEPGSENDIVLRQGDVLTVPERSFTVKISGEVRHPVTVNWQDGKKLSHYVKHAGGYSDMAKKSGVYVVYMNGSVEKIPKSSKKAIEPGCEIVIPRKSNRRLSTGEIMSLGTSTVSIASMIVMLINALK